MAPSLVSAITSLLLAVRYRSTCGVRLRESLRYSRKAINLGLCYGAFVPSYSLRDSKRAGRAAFLACAYDVVTDWRGFDRCAGERFARLLRALVPSWAVALALDLYRKDRAGALSDDGLERGTLALRFVTRLVGSADLYEPRLAGDLGVVLQIVDDLLDYKDDEVAGDTNCLLTSQRTHYLAKFESSVEQLDECFAHSPVMRFVLWKTKRRATALQEQFKLTPESREHQFSG